MLQHHRVPSPGGTGLLTTSCSPWNEELGLLRKVSLLGYKWGRPFSFLLRTPPATHCREGGAQQTCFMKRTDCSTLDTGGGDVGCVLGLVSLRSGTLTWASNRQQYEDGFRSISRNSQKNSSVSIATQDTRWRGFRVRKIWRHVSVPILITRVFLGYVP